MAHTTFSITSMFQIERAGQLQYWTPQAISLPCVILQQRFNSAFLVYRLMRQVKHLNL